MRIPHLPSLRAWSPAALFATLCAVASAHGLLRSALEYDRSAVSAGEVWRVFTAHLVHHDPLHLLASLVGLAAIWALVGDRFRPAVWVALMVAISGLVGLGLWALVPDVAGYIGASGVLHGLLAAGAVALWRPWRGGACAILAFLVVKTVSEQFLGPWLLPSGRLDTIIEAHLIGVVAGLIMAIPAQRV